jgi:hypothetical protein
MSLMQLFFWGWLGSVAVPVVQLALQYKGSLPEIYLRLSFYVIQFSLALIAGGLAIAHGANTALLAMHIGAATPLIVQGFSAKAP